MLESGCPSGLILSCLVLHAAEDMSAMSKAMQNLFIVVTLSFSEDACYLQGILSMRLWWRPPSKSVSSQVRTMATAIL